MIVESTGHCGHVAKKWPLKCPHGGEADIIYLSKIRQNRAMIANECESDVVGCLSFAVVVGFI